MSSPSDSLNLYYSVGPRCFLSCLSQSDKFFERRSGERKQTSGHSRYESHFHAGNLGSGSDPQGLIGRYFNEPYKSILLARMIETIEGKVRMFVASLHEVIFHS